MKKIKVCGNWDSSENITERLLLQFKTPKIDLSNISFVYDETYDVIVFFNHITQQIKKNSKSYIFPHEPTWSGSHQKKIPNGTIIFGFKNDDYVGECIELLAHTFYGGRGPWVDKLCFWNYENLINNNFVKEKNISSSITNLKDNNGISCLYPNRFKILESIKDFKFIDFFGCGENSQERKNSLIKYKFNLVIENEYKENWVTEKFYDCVLTDTIPIYYGCKNIKEIYKEDGYILINDINNVEEIKNLLVYIENNCDTIYSKKINNLKVIKQKYFDQNNLLKKIIAL